MATITFKYYSKSKEVYQNDTFITEYSDAPEELFKIIGELTTLTCDLSITTAPWGGKPHIMGHKHVPWDAKPHLKSKVTIGYRGKKMQFDFYHSIRNTEEWGISSFDSNFLKDVLYDLLCTIKFEAGTHGLSFREFCDEFGYDEDSRKAYDTYERCCDFSRDIAWVFSDEEIATFPS